MLGFNLIIGTLLSVLIVLALLLLSAYISVLNELKKGKRHCESSKKCNRVFEKKE